MIMRTYWRMELLPETAAGDGVGDKLGNGQLRMLPNEFRGKLAPVYRQRSRAGTHHSFEYRDGPYDGKMDNCPDATSSFVVVEPTWNFAALTETSPVVFRVPNRENAVVHISGRSANVHDRECSYEFRLERGLSEEPPVTKMFRMRQFWDWTRECEVSGMGSVVWRILERSPPEV